MDVSKRAKKLAKKERKLERKEMKKLKKKKKIVVTKPEVQLTSGTILPSPSRKRSLNAMLSSSSVRGSIAPISLNAAEQKRRRERMNRFAVQAPCPSLTGSHQVKGQSKGSKLRQEKDAPITGTSTSLEKKYLRLTARPHPSTVRPLSVLRQSFKLVVSKWKSDRQYAYVCEQLKSIRQDLTVQGHSDNHTFSLTVYKFHAQVAMLQGDLGEFNQCLTTLKSLFSNLQTQLSVNQDENDNTKAENLRKLRNSEIQFTAYQLLYAALTDNNLPIVALISEYQESVTKKQNLTFFHALSVLQCLKTYDYESFFKLYRCASKYSGALMSHMLEPIRERAYSVILKCYGPTFPLPKFRKMLGFTDSYKVNGGDTQEFVHAHNTVLVKLPQSNGKLAIDCKASLKKL